MFGCVVGSWKFSHAVRLGIEIFATAGDVASVLALLFR